jgi:hypothetical protein
VGWLSQILSGTDRHNVALQYHQQIFTDAGVSRPVVRQHDERDNDSGNPADCHTSFPFPVVMSALGLLTGMVQAYIFSAAGR